MEDSEIGSGSFKNEIELGSECEGERGVDSQSMDHEDWNGPMVMGSWRMF